MVQPAGLVIGLLAAGSCEHGRASVSTPEVVRSTPNPSAPAADPSVMAPSAVAANSARWLAERSVKSASGPSLVSNAAMARVPGGRFWMGRDDGPKNEGPAHEETVEPFSIDQTEVTVAAYSACVDAGACSAAGSGAQCNGGSNKLDHPINCVSFEQARVYCSAVGKTLPTETQWELAARGFDRRPFPWGKQAPSSAFLCWSRWVVPDGTCPVSSTPKGRSPVGVDDMAGNVFEWTSSNASADYRSNPDPSQKILRGGSWDNGLAEAVRTTLRVPTSPSVQANDTGFRCVGSEPSNH